MWAEPVPVRRRWSEWISCNYDNLVMTNNLEVPTMPLSPALLPSGGPVDELHLLCWFEDSR